MPAGQRDELELITQDPKLALEGGDGIAIEVGIPIEGGGTIMGEPLTRVAFVDRGSEVSGLIEIGRRGLEPKQIRVGSVGKRAGIADSIPPSITK